MLVSHSGGSDNAEAESGEYMQGITWLDVALQCHRCVRRCCLLSRVFGDQMPFGRICRLFIDLVRAESVTRQIDTGLAARFARHATTGPVRRRRFRNI